MRGAWVTTVYNLDWPFSTFDPSSVQMSDMKVLFDELERTGINAIFFQIRSESDAMYESSIEPWSRYLTGLQGREPDPFFDPLELAIELAHERGMELHAWMNPFRAVTITNGYTIAANHVTKTHPDWILSVNDLQVINPGIPEARDYIVDVVSDVVSRYEVDGIHFDDYFYPYPPNMILLEDDATFNQYGSGFLNANDWRRDNINVFVSDVQSAVKGIDPGVKFGISPFGIWKSGVPEGISGLSSYDVVFSDPLTWMEAQTVDYLVPQLYWPFGGGQDFALLAEWWVEQSSGIHIYPGIAAYRADVATSGSNGFSASEIPAQLDFSRQTDGIEGNVFFRARNLGPASNQGLTDALKNHYYSTKAFTAQMLYTDVGTPDAPTSLTASLIDEGVFLRWDPPLTGFAYANKFGIYRVRSDAAVPDALEMTNDEQNLISISWDPEFTDTDALEIGGRYYYAITGVTPNSIEGPETNLADVMILGTGIDALPERMALSSLDVFPNPARSFLTTELSLEQAAEVRVQIFDVLGREVADLYKGASYRSAGLLRGRWDLVDQAGQQLTPGVYMVVARTATERISQSFVILR